MLEKEVRRSAFSLGSLPIHQAEARLKYPGIGALTMIFGRVACAGDRGSQQRFLVSTITSFDWVATGPDCLKPGWAQTSKISFFVTSSSDLSEQGQ